MKLRPVAIVTRISILAMAVIAGMVVPLLPESCSEVEERPKENR